MPRPPRMSSPRRNDRGRGSHGSRLRHARMSRRAFSSNFGKASLLPLPSPLSFEPLHPRRALRCPILQRSRRRGREVECPGGLSLPRTSVLDILAVVLIAVIITVAASRAGQSQAPGKSTGLKWDTGTASGSQCSSTVEGSSRAFQCNIESLRQSGARTRGRTAVQASRPARRLGYERRRCNAVPRSDYVRLPASHCLTVPLGGS
jgi:hypothetical protein